MNNQRVAKIWFDSDLECYIQVPFGFCEWVCDKVYFRVQLSFVEYADKIEPDPCYKPRGVMYHWGSSCESLTGNNLTLWKFPSEVIKIIYLEALKKAIQDWNNNLNAAINTKITKDPDVLFS